MVDPKKFNISEAHDRGFKITTMSMVKSLKEDVNKSLRENYENTKK